MPIHDIAALEERGRTISAETYEEALSKLNQDETLFMLFQKDGREEAEPIVNYVDWDAIKGSVERRLYFNLRLLAVRDLR